MSNFDKQFKEIVKNLENNITDKESLELAKVEVFNLYNLFFDEITELEQTVNSKILAIAESQLHIEENIREMGKSIKNIEKDIYMEDDFEDEESDIEIKCPYCNKTFRAQMEDITAAEIICPECNNTIELDWNEGCGDDCDCCSHEGHCHPNDEEEE